MLLWLSLLLHGVAGAQTVVLNEVSNGPAGNQEYMELVVVPNGPFAPCSPPPCLDLRGWIFDDNNGYHGMGGVAPGVARFANHPLWACVPLGTIILIYNGGDPNGSLPPDDLSLNDGNCAIVISAHQAGYFERTGTTPAPVLCSNPGGWTATPPNWNANLAFANTGDCARVADASGCEVFSVCYGNTTLNASVAFAGAGGQRVWSFNSGDPFSAANWSTGCAAAGVCGGINDQTPGAPNNAANAAWIAQFNNNCTPVPIDDPLEVTVAPGTACGCDGTATATATGSSAPYTFVWHDAAWMPIGQEDATATGLCGGTYHVIATSATGCADTASVTVVSVDLPDAGTGGSVTVCADAAPVDLFDALGGTPQSGGSWSPPLPGGIFDPAFDAPGNFTYTVAGTPPCPAASATVVVSVEAVPQPTIATTDISCPGGSDGSIVLTIGPGHVFQWSGGLPGLPVQNGLAAGSHTVTVTSPAGCTSTYTITLTEPAPIVIGTSSTPAACGSATGSACVTVTGGTTPYTYAWNDPLAQATPCVDDLLPGTYTVTVTDANDCTASATAVVSDEPSDISLETTVQDAACGSATGSACVTATGGTVPYTYAWNDPLPQTTPCADGLASGTYTVTVTDANGCMANTAATVGEEPVDINVTATVQDVDCFGNTTGSITLTIVPPEAYTVQWSGPGGFAGTGMSITGLSEGTYAYVVSDPGGCSTNGTATVTGPAPLALIVNTLPETCAGSCDGSATVIASGGSPPMTMLVDGMAMPIGPVPGLCAGTHTVAVTDAKGCTADTVLIVAPGAPPVTVTVGPWTPVCVNGPAVVFHASPEGGTWSGPGIVPPQAGLFDPAQAGPGVHAITYTLDDACLSSQQGTVLVLPSPQAGFILQQGDAASLLVNTSTGATFFTWTVDGVEVSNATDLPWDPANGASYACLVATDAQGCSDTACRAIASSDPMVYVPNAFTPNGDGFNDHFGVHFAGPLPAHFVLSIFDRWGEEIFRSTNPGMRWDGSYKGRPAQLEVYVWQLIYAQADGSTRTIRGHVTLLL